MKLPRLIPVVLVASLLMSTGAPAQDTVDDLMAQFALLRDALRASNGLLVEDRPVVERLAARAESISADNPDDQTAAAIALQLQLWLDADADRIDAGWTRLMAMRPTDGAPARAAISWRLEAGLLDTDAELDAYESLVQRFPEDDAVLEAWASKLIDDTRYTQVIDVLESRIDLETTDPAVTYRLAESYYADNRFDDAVRLLEAIEGKDTAVREYPATLSGDVGRLLERARPLAEAWTAEQAIREAEAEADDLPRISVTTNKGTFELELYEDQVPNTVANFVSLASEGFYEGTAFHRVQPRDLARGGDPNSREGAEGRVGTGDPGYRVASEAEVDGARLAFGGTIAMEAQMGSVGSRFQLNFRPIDWLNQYPVFGRVISGFDVVRMLRPDDVISSMTVTRIRDHDYTVEKMPETEPAGISPGPPSALSLPREGEGGEAEGSGIGGTPPPDAGSGEEGGSGDSGSGGDPEDDG